MIRTRKVATRSSTEGRISWNSTDASEKKKLKMASVRGESNPPRLPRVYPKPLTVSAGPMRLVKLRKDTGAVGVNESL